MDIGNTIKICDIPTGHPEWTTLDYGEDGYKPVEKVKKRYIVTCQEYDDVPLLPKFGFNMTLFKSAYMVDEIEVARIGNTSSFTVDVVLRRCKRPHVLNAETGVYTHEELAPRLKA